MALLLIVAVSAAILVMAYRTYGQVLSRLLKLRDDVPTPAVQMRDDVDYVPIEPKFLMSQHFSAIAAAGPIVGPILAGWMFGWGPALIWIILGSILIGGVHDMTSLVASIRHKARSIADIVREYMSPFAYILFLVFIWIALVYIIVAFTDLVADSFVGVQNLGNGMKASGGAVASASALYLLLPIIMGLLLKFTKLSLNMATVIFLPLVAVSVWLGQYMPFNLDIVTGMSEANAQKSWDVILLGYCFVASIVPMWLLLQPRGHLGGYFLLVILIGGLVGLVVAGVTGKASVQYPAFIGWQSVNNQPLIPLLFITIACGACSGFHSIIASGTTSKQLCRETDAKVVGYGSMLLEAMVAVLSLATVIVLTKDAAILSPKPDPNAVYANGISQFMKVLGLDVRFAYAFVALAFTTFIYDTLDVCTRLGRYIVTELTGWKSRTGQLFATGLTAGAPLFFLLTQQVDKSGKMVPAWLTFWSLFGASNQLLAALTLVGVTVWLWRTYRKPWVWVVTGLPTVLMYVMSSWALLRFIRMGFMKADGGMVDKLPTTPVPWAAAVLLGLALLVLVEALRVFIVGGSPPQPRGEATTLPAA